MAEISTGGNSTTFSFCLAMFPRAKFRRAKGGVKAHVLDHDDCLPRYLLITKASGVTNRISWAVQGRQCLASV